MLPPFTRLPREIRDEIYSFVYANEDSLPITLRLFRRRVNRLSVARIDLALLLVNRQISTEAKTFFYSSHVFADEPANLFYFLRGIGDWRNLIKRIVIERTNPDTITAENVARFPQLFSTLVTMANLQAIKIYMYEKDLKRILERLGEWGFDCLDNGVAMTVQNMHVRGYNENHAINANGPLDIGHRTATSIWNRAKGETEWKVEWFAAKDVEDL